MKLKSINRFRKGKPSKFRSTKEYKVDMAGGSSENVNRISKTFLKYLPLFSENLMIMCLFDFSLD